MLSFNLVNVNPVKFYLDLTAKEAAGLHKHYMQDVSDDEEYTPVYNNPKEGFKINAPVFTLVGIKTLTKELN